jgi:hypothetical protein
MLLEEAKEIVLRRLEGMPPQQEVIIDSRSYHREALIEHVKLGNAIGQQMVAKQLKIFKALRLNGVWR